MNHLSTQATALLISGVILPLSSLSAQSADTFEFSVVPASEPAASTPTAATEPTVATGVVAGRVVDKESGAPLRGVAVLAEGSERASVTDERGAYVLNGLPVGAYTLSFVKEGYIDSRVTEVKVAADETKVVNFALTVRPAEMTDDVFELTDFTVTADEANQLVLNIELQRTSATQLAIMSSEDFSKFAASDIAEAVKSITGVSLSGGKYAVVRGLNDRYSVTQLNGATMPSPDPDRPAVPLDIFPTGIFQSIETRKTHSPDLPGEATGGVIDLRLISFPEERIIKFTASTGFNSETDERWLESSRSNSADLWADGAGERDFTNKPSVVFGPITGAQLNPNNPNNRIAELNNALSAVNTPFIPTRRRPDPDFSGAVLLGDTFTLRNGQRVGAFFAANQSVKRRYVSQDVSATGSLEDGGAVNSLGGGSNNGHMVNEWGATRETGTQEAQVSVVVGAGLEFSEGKQINYGYLFTRNGQDEAVVQTGGNRWRADGQGVPSNQTFDGQDPLVPPPGQASYNYSAYTQRRLEAHQLDGVLDYTESPLGMKFDWAYLQAGNEQIEPDTYDSRGIGYRFRRETTQESDVLATNVTVDLAKHIKRLDIGRGTELKLGLYEESSDRAFEQRQQQLQRTNTSLGGGQLQFTSRWVDRTLAAPVLINGQLFNPPAGITGQADGIRDISGHYAMLDTRPTDWLQVVGGVRVEDTQLSYSGFGFVPDPNNNALIYAPSLVDPRPIDQTDYIPSINLNFDLPKDVKLRFAYSKTVARPTYRELQPFPLLNVATNEVEVGNPGLMQSGFAPNPVIQVIPDAFDSFRGLRMAEIENYDARAEWYPTDGAMVAFGVFYKKVGNPIERIQAVQQNLSLPVYTFVNNENSADLYGAELELQHNLGALLDSPAFDFLSFGGNVTLIDAEVKRTALETQAVTFDTDINPADISETRSLYDQPDLIANLYVSLAFEDIGSEFTLSMNHTGDRLVGAFGPGGPDIFEAAVTSLNLVYTQRFKRVEGLVLKLSAKNLNDPTYRRVTRTGESRVPLFDENGAAIGERDLESYKEGVSYSVSLSYAF